MKIFGKRRHRHVAADISTREGRRRAEQEEVFGDHGFLRASFQNLHAIGPDMWRSNQPNAAQIAEHVRLRGIRTIINCRGPSTRGYYLLEREACQLNNVELIDFQVYSRDTPKVETVLAARDLFQNIKYPALLHCKSGADRAGLMSVFYQIFQRNYPVSLAKRQLSKKYLHLREGKTGLLDAFFEAYLEHAETSGLSFLDWLTQVYDRAAIKEKFLKTGVAQLSLDQLIRRE